MFYVLLCILTVCPIVDALQPGVSVQSAEAQTQGSCLPLVVGTWELNCVVIAWIDGAVAYPGCRVASANLVNNAES